MYRVRDLTSSLSQLQNNFIKEDDPIFDEDTLLGRVWGYWFSGILIFGSGTKVTIFYFHFSPCDTSYSMST